MQSIFTYKHTELPYLLHPIDIRIELAILEHQYAHNKMQNELAAILSAFVNVT